MGIGSMPDQMQALRDARDAAALAKTGASNAGANAATEPLAAARSDAPAPLDAALSGGSGADRGAAIEGLLNESARPGANFQAASIAAALRA